MKPLFTFGEVLSYPPLPYFIYHNSSLWPEIHLFCVCSIHIIICLVNVILSPKLENIVDKHWVSPSFPGGFFFFLNYLES